MRKFGLAVALLMVSAFSWSGVLLHEDTRYIEKAWVLSDSGADVLAYAPAEVTAPGEVVERSTGTVTHAEPMGSAGRYGTQIIQNRVDHPGIGYRVKNPPDE